VKGRGALVDVLQRPPVGREAVVRLHYARRRAALLAQVGRWAAEAGLGGGGANLRKLLGDLQGLLAKL
jgi:hypothetical protein